MTTVAAIPDPRVFPEPGSAPPEVAELFARIEASLAADTGAVAAAVDAEVRTNLAHRLRGDGPGLAALFARAPSVTVARHLWRQLELAARETGATPGAALAATVFALPVVIVAGIEATSGEATLPGILEDANAITALLREHGALGGNRTFGIANALVASEAIDLPRLPEILAWQRLPEGSPDRMPLPERVLVPAPLAVAAGHEAVHLRFLVGTALARADVDLLADATVGRWGAPLTRELARQLGVGPVRVLPLPRAPQRLLPAVVQGRTAQRDVSAQLFAGNAIRRIRAAVGEPTAVISAHRAPDAPGGGELRLSLSSPFAARDAEGFRCPLAALDRVGDVVAMLADLMTDCRVTDVRHIGGIHPDRDPATGVRLLFKPETIPAVAGVLH
ncbi:MAG: hypothetical protein ABI886_08955 [Betaproteobacteria bacterium]